VASFSRQSDAEEYAADVNSVKSRFAHREGAAFNQYTPHEDVVMPIFAPVRKSLSDEALSDLINSHLPLHDLDDLYILARAIEKVHGIEDKQ